MEDSGAGVQELAESGQLCCWRVWMRTELRSKAIVVGWEEAQLRLLARSLLGTVVAAVALAAAAVGDDGRLEGGQKLEVPVLSVQW